MRKILLIGLLFFGLVAKSQEAKLKCLLPITPVFSETRLHSKYDERRDTIDFDFRAPEYKSKMTICATDLIFKNYNEPYAYVVFIKDEKFYVHADLFKLKDSVNTIWKFRSMGRDSLEIYRNFSKEFQLNNFEKYKANNKAKMIKKYGAKATQRILNGDVWIGMTRDMLIESIGHPTKVNSMETAYSYSSQYIYESRIFGTRYIYLDNGRVTAIQDY